MVKECYSLIIYLTSSHSTSIIRTLKQPALEAAVDSYADALMAVFICQAAVNVICLLSCVLIQGDAMLYVPWFFCTDVTDDPSI